MLTKTKIVATITPNMKKEKIKKMMQKGMNVARFTMFNVEFDQVRNRINVINELNKELDLNVAIMIDLNGPEVRLGSFRGHQVSFAKGDRVRIVTDEVLGDTDCFMVDYDNFASEVKYGSIIQVKDGLMLFEVVKKDADGIIVEALTEGTLEDYQLVSVKDTKFDIPFLNNRDRAILSFANEIHADFITLSHVRTSEDVLVVNDLLIIMQNDNMQIISKIANEDAVLNMDDIIHVSDGIMIARGSLGLEIPMERVPGVQKKIINKCHDAGIISIVATDLLSSMENHLRPTRAEVSDVANAVLDGTDAVLLSGETMIGAFPVETVDMLRKIINSAEQDIVYTGEITKLDLANLDDTAVIAHSVADAASLLSCVAIVAPTISGYTARMVSKYRPVCPIIAISPNEETVKSLQLHFAIIPVLVSELKSLDKIIEVSKNMATKVIKTKIGDKVIVTGGYPFRDIKTTNFMKIEEL